MHYILQFHKIFTTDVLAYQAETSVVLIVLGKYVCSNWFRNVARAAASLWEYNVVT